MTLLVAGGTAVDAGKTTFSAGLCARLDAPGFKPRAGNDFWYDHDDVRAVLSAGRLHGKDAARLVEAAPGEAAPEDVNPVHRLWRPAPGEGRGLLGRPESAFLCDRVGESFVVNATVDLPALVRDSLPLDDARRVESVADLNAVSDALHLPALDALADRVDAADVAVVESYADVARPLRDLVPDAVAVVDPGLVRVYPGERFARACDVAHGGTTQGDGRLETRTGDVTDLLDPAARASLPPLPSATRADPTAVAEAYADAYDDLLALARSQ
ncbi:MAG: ATPase [Halobacteriaceae archaeon]